MGKFEGKAKGYDQRLELHSVRVQRAESVANDADPDGKIVWKNKPVAQTASATTGSTASAGSTSAGSSGANSTNKIQD